MYTNNAYDTMQQDGMIQQESSFKKQTRTGHEGNPSSQIAPQRPPTSGADVFWPCNSFVNPWPADYVPEYCTRRRCRHECCRKDYYMDNPNDPSLQHCTGEPMRFARSRGGKRGPSGGSFAGPFGSPSSSSTDISMEGSSPEYQVESFNTNEAGNSYRDGKKRKDQSGDVNGRLANKFHKNPKRQSIGLSEQSTPPVTQSNKRFKELSEAECEALKPISYRG